MPWTARRSNHSTLNEINPEYSLEGLILKLQHCGHLMWRADSLAKTLTLGKIEGQRKRGHQKMRCLDSITDSMNMDLSKFQETVECSILCWSLLGHKKSGNLVTEWQLYELILIIYIFMHYCKGFYYVLPDLIHKTITWDEKELSIPLQWWGLEWLRDLPNDPQLIKWLLARSLGLSIWTFHYLILS